jgi:uncharacterized protein (TIGR02453 family)
MITKHSFNFLKGLKANNSKDWMDNHKNEYHAAKQEFIEFVDQIINKMSKGDPEYWQEIDAKKCLFRINRDIRFSANKNPYKTNFGASLNKAGKKSPLAGYYLHLEPGNCFIGGGLYDPMPDLLSKIRQEVDYNLPHFQKILSSKAFKSAYPDSLMQEGALKRPPKGYDLSNPALPYLKLKHFIAIQKISDKEILADNAIQCIAKQFQALKPLIDFLNNTLQEIE